MRIIVCTTGTSIAARLAALHDKGPHERENAKRLRAAIQDRLRDLEQEDPKTFLKRAAAETNSLERLDAKADDLVVLLHTETNDGTVCAEELAKLITAKFGIEPELHKVSGLQVKDPERFSLEGIQNLFEQLDSLHKLAQGDETTEIVLNVTGGFKSTVPYITLYGMLNYLPIVYIFESSEALITLPPMPLGFDWEKLSAAREALRKLVDQTAMPKEAFFQAIPQLQFEDRKLFSALVQDAGDGQVWPSPFALLLFQQMKQDSAATVLISPKARKAYDRSRGAVKQQFTFMLERVREPLLRQVHMHSIQGTRLNIFKPGRTAERIAFRVVGSKIFVCELGGHDIYESVGPDLSHYDLGQFEVWTRPQEEAPPPASQDALLATWEDEMAHETEEREKAERLYEEAQAALDGETARRQRLEAQVASLAAEKEKMSEALTTAQRPWWQRLFNRA